MPTLQKMSLSGVSFARRSTRSTAAPPATRVVAVACVASRREKLALERVVRALGGHGSSPAFVPARESRVARILGAGPRENHTSRCL